MNVATLRKIAREYRIVAERKLDDKELCKGFAEICRTEGIAWTQLRALVDAETADGRDGGHRVGKIVEKADFASSYAEILADEQKRETCSQSTDHSVDATDMIAVAPQKPAHSIFLDPVPQTKTASALQASVALARAGADPFDYPDIPAYLDRRPHP